MGDNTGYKLLVRQYLVCFNKIVNSYKTYLLLALRMEKLSCVGHIFLGKSVPPFGF